LRSAGDIPHFMRPVIVNGFPTLYLYNENLTSALLQESFTRKWLFSFKIEAWNFTKHKLLKYINSTKIGFSFAGLNPNKIVQEKTPNVLKTWGIKCLNVETLLVLLSLPTKISGYAFARGYRNAYKKRDTGWVSFGTLRQHCRAVVPNQGGIPPKGGISWIQWRNFHFIVKLHIHCKCWIFYSWHWLFLLVTSLYICKLFCGLSHVFVDKFECHVLPTNSFSYINQIFVVNEDHCSNCSWY